LINFKDWFKMPSIKPKPKPEKKDLSERKARHMHPIGRDPYTRKVHPGDFVPEYHRPVIENPKFKRIKKGKSKFEILQKRDVKEICDVFGVRPNIYKDRKLGNTGITISFDHTRNKFILRKDK
jgi:hypothetical protein